MIIVNIMTILIGRRTYPFTIVLPGEAASRRRGTPASPTAGRPHRTCYFVFVMCLIMPYYCYF